MPTPYERARGVWLREACARTFDEDLRLHFINGFVFSTPDFFVMGRGVNSKYEERFIVDPAYKFSRDIQDCWHCYLLSGEISKAWNVLPYPLPMFSLERRNELRFYRFADIARHAMEPITA